MTHVLTICPKIEQSVVNVEVSWLEISSLANGGIYDLLKVLVIFGSRKYLWVQKSRLFSWTLNPQNGTVFMAIH